MKRKEKPFWRVMLNKYGKAEVYEIHEYIQPENEGDHLHRGAILFFNNKREALIAASSYDVIILD